MKKRILGIVLAICLVFFCVPITVFAIDTDDLQSMLNAGGTVKLTKDYTIDKTLIVEGTDVVLDLNGHVIKMTEKNSVIRVEGKLTMKDSNKTAKHTDTSLPAGGVITNSKTAAPWAGGVNVNGSFTLAGGTIYKCSANNGGGVQIQQNSKMIMTGGTIKDCTAVAAESSFYFGKGGGVQNKGGTFEMRGGTIENCTAECSDSLYGGGGVYNDSSSSFVLQGGTIKNCSATRNGGGVNSFGNFSMSGGTISNCRANSGGGVYNYNSGTFKMNGGTIDNCDAESTDTVLGCGGGVDNDGAFEMTGSTIKNCSADIRGGGVSNRGTFTMADIDTTVATIDNCSAGDGGGVYNGDNSSFKMNGGIIKNCSAVPFGTYAPGRGGGAAIYGTFEMYSGTI